MPVDPSSSTSSRHKSSRREQDGFRIEGSYAREIELKRSRGEISCAECRRLKIKCDKQIPCQSCQRRGCAALCPNGSLATGQGTRFVIAATEHLHKRIARMSDRIRQLEDALSVLQSAHSHEQHPLLQDAMLVLDQDKLEERATDSDDGEGPADSLGGFGTISISEQGVSRFFGTTGGSENLLLIDHEDTHQSPKSNSTRSTDSPPATNEFSRFSFAFPFTPMGTPPEVQNLIMARLPPFDVASAMCETYLNNAAWLFRSIDRQQLMGDMLPAVYRLKPPQLPASADVDYTGPHALALFLSILSVACIVDIGRSTATAEADGEHYNQLAMAALVLKPVLEHPSLISIQALHVASIYNAMSGSEVSAGAYSMETTWSQIALAAHLAHTLGLHRDSARWEPDPRMVQRRRMLFWDLFVADSWHTLSHGRPPSLSRMYIDCQYPQDTEMKLDSSGNTEPGFGSWGFRFAYECVAEVAAKTLATAPPRYSEILELDRRIREFAIPADAIAALRGNATDFRDVPLSASMTLCVLSHTREVILMYMHRSFFAQALIEDPVNPLRTPYVPSFLASVRCASTILRVIRDQFTVHPSMCSRFWSMWTFAFSAAIVFGVIVTRGPRSHLADTSMVELEQACELFAMASKYNRRAAKAHMILMRLRDKALRILNTARAHASGSPADDGAAWDVKQEDLSNDELSIFAARAKVVRSGERISSSASPPMAPHLADESLHSPITPSHPNGYAPGWQPPSTQPQQYQQTHYMAHMHAGPPPTLPPFHQAPSATYSYGNEGPRSAPTLLRIPSHDPHPVGAYVSTGTQQTNPDAVHLFPPSYPQTHNHSSMQQVHPENVYGYTEPPTELVQLGLSSTGRLQENWNSFMHQTGILG